MVGGIDPDDFAVARYNANGTLDSTFSGDGKQTTDFGGYESANGVAVQGDGKIVVVGVSANNSTTNGAAFVLARYNPDGSLDTSFSGDGKQAIGSDFDVGDRRGDPGGRQDRRRRYLLRYARRQPVPDRPLSRQRLARPDVQRRRHPNDPLPGARQRRGRRRERGGDPGERQDRRGRIRGSQFLDQPRTSTATSPSPATTRTARSTRASPATASRRLTSRTVDQADDVAIQSDGKIVVVGCCTGHFTLVRYNPNGSLDASFSGDGKRATDFNGTANAVAIQANGKIVAAGGAGAEAPPAATSPSPATTRTARSTRASPATASEGPISGEPNRRTESRSRRTAGSSRLGSSA